MIGTVFRNRCAGTGQAERRDEGFSPDGARPVARTGGRSSGGRGGAAGRRGAIRPARRPQQQDRLPRGNKPLGSRFPEAAAGLLEVHCAEHLLAEVAVFTTGRGGLAGGHWGHPSKSRPDRSDPIPQIAGKRISRTVNNPAIWDMPLRHPGESCPGLALNRPAAARGPAAGGFRRSWPADPDAGGRRVLSAVFLFVLAGQRCVRKQKPRPPTGEAPAVNGKDPVRIRVAILTVTRPGSCLSGAR